MDDEFYSDVLDWMPDYDDNRVCRTIKSLPYGRFRIETWPGFVAHTMIYSLLERGETNWKFWKFG